MSMLPELNGLEVLRRIRAQQHTPLMLLIARETAEGRVVELKCGAEDYLSKPFAYAELLARTRALLRRRVQSSAISLPVADMEVDVIRQHVRRGNVRIELTAEELPC
ncbi:hypothetical protein BZM26_29275 [Paraburkholderia strydomiana]|nr:hypothetical protein BZM26_29275 [Paraburkholderia strydomiana]